MMVIDDSGRFQRKLIPASNNLFVECTKALSGSAYIGGSGKFQLFGYYDAQPF